MNVPTQKELLQLFDQQQVDHPIGSIAARFVEQALKKHPPPTEKKSKKRRSQRHTHRPSSETKGDNSS
ncbi:hypothetical protein TRFO_39005 [Tritrichomonas foetus]|uniref:Uncharacterized protein n=1 Tax=Tritrichomonas foetus TaxID=1144522 RepID=A0A1J4J6I5_9EUKA|nr:hypothetical protein TRFO_39005 [Tritrichomonas foetus]|eukprot:OHS94816.1 hypothetical protein TRFO_39005 [Tritrichomonas foetus]